MNGFSFWFYGKAFTLFAPTNEAFANMPRELRARVDSFRGNIENPILRYHVSDRKVTSDTFQADQTIPTLYNGNRLRVNKYSNGVSACILNLREREPLLLKCITLMTNLRCIVHHIQSYDLRIMSIHFFKLK